MVTANLARKPAEGEGWVRPEAVAGMFYPRQRGKLWALLQELGNQAKVPASAGLPMAIIAPHAGYVYSGPIAASAYAWLRAAAGQVHLVGLVGPSHRAAFRGLATSSAAAFATPLGPVAVDRDALARLMDLPFVQVLDAAHQHEHALEVQLPFLMWALDYERHPLAIAPLLTGDVSGEEVAQAIQRLWDQRALVVVSSDLSHYHDYETAKKLDSAASRAIERLAPRELAVEQACGQVAIQGLLLAAAARGLKAHTVDLRSSGDTAGPRDQVVGYGAYVFVP